MKRKKLTKTFMMISNWKKPWSHMVYTKSFQRGDQLLTSESDVYSRQNLTSVDVRF